jgi:hypothetical protein
MFSIVLLLIVINLARFPPNIYIYVFFYSFFLWNQEAVVQQCQFGHHFIDTFCHSFNFCIQFMFPMHPYFHTKDVEYPTCIIQAVLGRSCRSINQKSSVLTLPVYAVEYKYANSSKDKAINMHENVKVKKMINLEFPVCMKIVNREWWWYTIG